MYVPKIFRPPSAEAIRNYIEVNSFATLVGQKDGRPVATHTPLYLERRLDKEYLVGHISIANNQKSCITEKQEMVAIFMENHTYISSSWYDHVNVPTWNYIAVHIYGKVRKLNDANTLKCIETLVKKYESRSENPFSIAQMSEKDLKTQLRGIVAFEMEISEIEGSWKLSQNRHDNDHEEIINKLKERGDEMSLHIAREMQSMRKE